MEHSTAVQNDARNVATYLVRRAISDAIRPGTVTATPRYKTAAGVLVAHAMFSGPAGVAFHWQYQETGKPGRVVSTADALDIIAAHIAKL